MGLVRRVLLTFSAILWSSIAAQAGTVVYSNLGPGDTYNVGQGATICNDLAACFAVDEDFAVGFMPSATYRLDSISLPVGLAERLNLLAVLLATNSPCQVTCGSWGGLPSNSVIEAFQFSNAMGPFGAANPLLVATSTVRPILQANTLYWVVADAIDGSGTSAAWNGSVPLNLGPAAQIGGSGGSQWVAVAGQGALRVTGDPVPGPASITLVGFGLAILLWVHVVPVSTDRASG